MDWNKIYKGIQLAKDLADVYTKHKGQNTNDDSSKSQPSNSSKK